MRVVIAGGHGQIAMQLERLLAARGDDAVGIVRNPDHVADLEQVGAKAVVLDLERSSVDDLVPVLSGADAVVFAAGAGPGSGSARKDTVDRDAAVLLADGALAAGVRRYVMVSAIRADEGDPDSDEVFQVYLRAKGAADAYVREQDLDWTVVRPGRLTDEPGTGQVRLGPDVEYGEVPRADVAATLLGVLDDPATAGKQFNLVGGGTPVATALTDV
ncbi:MAG TPA: SDR family oxidoreductase [Nocardioidaceae bacterium]|nr:SDR family oxidoreductase [Nocardioidaceae bacterium]